MCVCVSVSVYLYIYIAVSNNFLAARTDMDTLAEFIDNFSRFFPPTYCRCCRCCCCLFLSMYFILIFFHFPQFPHLPRCRCAQQVTGTYGIAAAAADDDEVAGGATTLTLTADRPDQVQSALRIS